LKQETFVITRVYRTTYGQ